MTATTPLVLLILDGWGMREAAPDNAISAARTPCWDRLLRDCPHALLETSGQAVGLPAGQMGNSEVGHMNIGAGRIVYQELTRITRAIEDGEFSTNAALCEAISSGRNTCIHILGLLSNGGVHSHEDHLFETVRMAAAHGADHIAVHVFLDGRDTPPRSAADSISRLESLLNEIPAARIASVCGRYFAMDRDQRWTRTARAWNAIVHGQAEYRATSATAALQAAYQRGENDEFVQPTLIGDGRRVRDDESVIFINFRADRARQLSQAFVDPGFAGFETGRPRLAAFATMTRYIENLPALVAFPPDRLRRLFGEELARAGKSQLRIAETEKYAHVTYFFNGGEEQIFDGEDRILIPSPKVATYDLQPEMSAPALTEALVEAIGSGQYSAIICNVANPDMVGHSGIFEAAVQACEAVDRLLDKVVLAVRIRGGELLITADHGNVEQMSDPANGQAHTAHTTNPVPLVYLGRAAEMAGNGSLRDIAPTMLTLLGLPIPEEMTGRNLITLHTE